MVTSDFTYVIDVIGVIGLIGVIGVIDVIGVIRFCKGPPFLSKRKNNIHNHVIDVIDVIEFLMYMTKW